jgi:hypothetical protein
VAIGGHGEKERRMIVHNALTVSMTVAYVVSVMAISPKFTTHLFQPLLDISVRSTAVLGTARARLICPSGKL